MDKQYVATWIINGYSNPKYETVDDRFFYDDNGYDEEARRIIDSLAIGEIKMLDIEHSIRRIA